MVGGNFIRSSLALMVFWYWNFGCTVNCIKGYRVKNGFSGDWKMNVTIFCFVCFCCPFELGWDAILRVIHASFIPHLFAVHVHRLIHNDDESRPPAHK